MITRAFHFFYPDRAIVRRSRRDDDIATRAACEIYAKKQIRRIAQQEAYESAVATQVQARLHALTTAPPVAHVLVAVPAPTAVAVKPDADLGACTSTVKYEKHSVIDLTRD